MVFFTELRLTLNKQKNSANIDPWNPHLPLVSIKTKFNWNIEIGVNEMKTVWNKLTTNSPEADPDISITYKGPVFIRTKIGFHNNLFWCKIKRLQNTIKRKMTRTKLETLCWNAFLQVHNSAQKGGPPWIRLCSPYMDNFLGLVTDKTNARNRDRDIRHSFIMSKMEICVSFLNCELDYKFYRKQNQIFWHLSKTGPSFPLPKVPYCSVGTVQQIIYMYMYIHIL